MSVTSLASYQALVNDRLVWRRQAFGHQDNRAIAFIPQSDCIDPEKAIQRVVNMFANHDSRPRKWNILDDGTKIEGEYPAPPQACSYHDFTYVNITDERLHATLVNYFTASLPRELGKIVLTNETAEDGPDIEWVCDEAQVEALAVEAALHVMTHFIKDDGFMSHERVYAPQTYALGHARSEPGDFVEQTASAVG